MILLNLGCGSRTSDRPGVVNIDWSMYLRIKRQKWLAPIVPLVLHGHRLEIYRRIPDNILVHDLSTGIPFDDDSVDVVYHSHMFEHLDRDVAEQFLLEVHRVLRVGGIHRVVVPDLEQLCRDYLHHLETCSNTNQEDEHDKYIAAMYEQSVRREAYGTSQQSRLRKVIEKFIRGDARAQGETHQWMYDRASLTAKLRNAGYSDIQIHRFDTSGIQDWTSYGLDNDAGGTQYKPGSLYIEASKEK